MLFYHQSTLNTNVHLSCAGKPSLTSYPLPLHPGPLDSNAPCQTQRIHLSPSSKKRTEDGRRSEEERIVCEAAGCVCTPGSPSELAGPRRGRGQRPEQWAEGFSTPPRGHHYRGSVLCAPPTTCRQGTLLGCVFMYVCVCVCGPFHHFWQMLVIQACYTLLRSMRESAGRCESSMGSRGWRPWCTPWIESTQTPTSSRISAWAARSGQKPITELLHTAVSC